MRIWKYGDNINTDLLFPGRYTYTCATAEEILPHLLEDLDADFARFVQPGDLLMAGDNFGCGSSREQPAMGLMAAGINAIIAGSFARIFYRAAINHGLTLIECAAAVNAWKKGDTVTLNFAEGRIIIGTNLFEFPALPDEIQAIRNAGGLLPFIRLKLSEKNIHE